MSINKLRNALIEKENELDSPNLYNDGWDLNKVYMATKRRHGYTIKNIYNFDDINTAYQKAKDYKKLFVCDNQNTDIPDLDPYMWSEFTNTLEQSRVVIFNSCIEYGVDEVESYFLSIKWSISTLKKFRNKFFNAMNGKENKTDYNRTALRDAVNILIKRFEIIRAPVTFIYSALAAETSNFRKTASWDIARELAEDTGVILHAKLTL